MIHLNLPQGGHDWLMARCGLPTASQFHRIVTPKGSLSAARERFKCDLLAEIITGQPLVTFTSDAMNRGTDMEAEAVAAYEFECGVDTGVCGLCLTDDQRVGASPDRLIQLDEGKVAGLQVKCPEEPGIHVGYLLGNLADKHKAQVQGEILVAEMEWEDLISYHPDFPLAIVRVHPDDAYQKALRKALDTFTEELAYLVERAKAADWIKELQPQPDDSEHFLTDEDVEAVIAAAKNEGKEQNEQTESRPS